MRIDSRFELKIANLTHYGNVLHFAASNKGDEIIALGSFGNGKLTWGVHRGRKIRKVAWNSHAQWSESSENYHTRIFVKFPL